MNIHGSYKCPDISSPQNCHDDLQSMRHYDVVTTHTVMVWECRLKKGQTCMICMRTWCFRNQEDKEIPEQYKQDGFLETQGAPFMRQKRIFQCNLKTGYLFGNCTKNLGNEI